MNEQDLLTAVMMIFGWFLIAIAGTGVIFMLDAFLFGLTGRSFIGAIDKLLDLK
jgi:hypothetical protein